MRVLLAAALLIALPVAHAAELIGRVFFTPQERTLLDAARSQRALAERQQLMSKTEPPPETVTYSGIVRRADGKATVWINNRAIPDSEVGSRQALVGRIEQSGQVVLQRQQPIGPAGVRLKVGQSVELMSGRVTEPYVTPPTAPTTRAAVPEAAKPSAPAAAAETQAAPPDPEAPPPPPQSAAPR